MHINILKDNIKFTSILFLVSNFLVMVEGFEFAFGFSGWWSKCYSWHETLCYIKHVVWLEGLVFCRSQNHGQIMFQASPSHSPYPSPRLLFKLQKQVCRTQLHVHIMYLLACKPLVLLFYNPFFPLQSSKTTLKSWGNLN